MVSKTEEYALRAMVYLAARYGAGPVRAADLARRTGVPRNYASKILHQLARSGVVRSERGRHGGFRLAAPPEDTTLQTVLAPFEPQVRRGRCLLGRSECSDDHPCGAHDGWKVIKEARAAFLSGTSLADVLGDERLPEQP